MEKKYNLIGIAGKKGSGKDLIGRILQGLFLWKLSPIRDNYIEDVLLYLETLNGINPRSGPEIKKFADKLKDMVCLLIGCTIEQLEDRDFKDRDFAEKVSIEIT